MNRKIIWLNLALLGLLGLAAVRLREEWQLAHAHQDAVLQKKVAPAAAPAAVPAPKPSPVTASSYSEIAEKMLFTKDRNPTIIVAPPEVKPPKPMPPLPVVYGVMGLPSGPVALMSEARGKSSKGYRKGEKVGEFEIAALDTKQITLHWEDKVIVKDINELIDRGGGNPETAANGAGAPAAAPPPVNQPAATAAPSKPGTPGNQTSETSRACKPGDTTADGTVVDGYQKLTSHTPFGDVCHWDAVK